MLKPEQIRSHRFISAGRGTYEAGDVDSFLSEVAVSYEQVFRENGDLVKKISLLSERVSQLPPSVWQTRFSVNLSRARRNSLILLRRERRSLSHRHRTEPMFWRLPHR